MKNELSLPHTPGVCIFKNGLGEILYIGKAKDLHKRVTSYFSKVANDWKVAQLIQEHETIGHISTHSEIEALLLEAYLIKQFQPKFNVLLKNGNPFIYFHIKEPSDTTKLPQLELIRQEPKKGRYIGPFIHKSDARALYDYLVRTFHIFICNKSIEQGCLDYHIGRCAGSCRSDFDRAAYLQRLELAFALLSGNKELFNATVHDAIKRHNSAHEFETSRSLVELQQAIEPLFNSIEHPFSPERYTQALYKIMAPAPLEESDYAEAAEHLRSLLQIESAPKTIDCFDISHFQSNALVGSCVRFTNGKADHKGFRRFTIKTLSQQNDYAALQEIIRRRYKEGDFPDIVVIDGGKGQRNAALPFVGATPCISLAKREERLFTSNHPEGIKLSLSEPLGRLLIALRDYAHHTAISYHRTKRTLN